MKPERLAGEIIRALLLTSILCGISTTAWCQDAVATNQPGRLAASDEAQTASAPVRQNEKEESDDQVIRQEDWQSEIFIPLANQAERIARNAQEQGSPVQTVLTVAALSLLPVLLLMTTSYVRLFVVLSLLRQAIGTQQLPSNQVVMGLSFFITVLVMSPVWQQVKTDAIDPASRSDGTFDYRYALEHGVRPIHEFMVRQIEAAGNRDAVAVFYEHQPAVRGALPEDLSRVPVTVILPAFLISELKVAFLLGFQIFLPFLILDIVVSTLTVSMGMVMTPPSMISLPLKLILFVMVDGWNLVVGMLLQSFGSGA